MGDSIYNAEGGFSLTMLYVFQQCGGDSNPTAPQTTYSSNQLFQSRNGHQTQKVINLHQHPSHQPLWMNSSVSNRTTFPQGYLNITRKRHTAQGFSAIICKKKCLDKVFFYLYIIEIHLIEPSLSQHTPQYTKFTTKKQASQGFFAA